MTIDPARIRNFSIIAHIDHGKSTLADRFLEITGAVTGQDMVAQFLDQMELERERGITIKGKAVTMTAKGTDGLPYQLNLIDTPGHVDFGYEVSRALASCEGALLIVDASQGIEAQTIANAFLALDNNLTLIPVINKVDLPQAEPERVAEDLQRVFGFDPEEIIFTSAKEGTGVHEVVQAVIERVPPPKGSADAPLRGLVFDSIYNPYKGIVAYVRIFDGQASLSDRLLIMSSSKTTESMEIGVFSPQPTPTDSLSMGQVGYIATGLKDVRECAVGDTLTVERSPAKDPLPGYVPLKPMVFAGLYPADGENYQSLRSALEKLQLNDAALSFEAESSPALGFGARCGFLGLLHMDIVQERLEREYGLDIVVTAPSVVYKVHMKDGDAIDVETPAKLPSPSDIEEVREPWLALTIVSPSRHVGAVMELMSTRRAEYKRMEYIQAASDGDDSSAAGDARVLMEYDMPMSELLAEFYNRLKSRTQGYASLDYSFIGYRSGSSGEVGHSLEPGAGGRSVYDRTQGQVIPVWPDPGGKAETGHPPAAFRGPHTGCGGQQDYCKGNGAGPPQGRSGQMLRRRHHPQAQAPGTSERGQEAAQEGRQCGRSSRSLPGPAESRGE